MPDPLLPPAPSKAKLVLATVGALALAGAVLVAFVLPAEYGIDPLGTGEALGLRVLSGAVPASEIPVREDGLIAQEDAFRRDHRSFLLEPGGFVEYKYRLEAGQAMVYAWSSTNWVRSEMHSEADGAPEGTAEFFEVAEQTLFRDGSYVAPFPGIHGWYWLNETERPVTVTIDASGFFTYAVEFLPDVAPVMHDIPATPRGSATSGI